MGQATEEQRHALEQFMTGDDLVIEAGAGSGKTSTLRLFARYAEFRGLYLAFNASVASEAREKFSGTGVSAKTAHAMAFASHGAPRKARLNLPFAPWFERAKQVGAFPFDFASEHGASRRRVTDQDMARAAFRAVDLFCISDADEIGPAHVELPRGLQVNAQGRASFAEAVIAIAQRIWRDVEDPNGSGKVTHQNYFKLFQLSRPRLRFDVVFVDEAQDSDPVLLAILREQQHLQRVMVGDRAQAIYSWRGAVDAMDAFDGARTARLTKSFRFGPAIADEANLWLAALGSDMRIEGNDAVSSRVGEVHSPDAILVRSNGGAIAELVAAQERGARVGLAGRGRAQELRRLAKAAWDLQFYSKTSHPELALFYSWSEVQEFAESDEGRSLSAFVKVIDRYGAKPVMAALDATYEPESADVVIGTAHTAKGLEWGQVRVSDDFPQPHRDAEGGERVPDDEEFRLAYVTVTRAMNALETGSLSYVGDLAPA